jgi:hypothetical protein
LSGYGGKRPVRFGEAGVGERPFVQLSAIGDSAPVAVVGSGARAYQLPTGSFLTAELIGIFLMRQFDAHLIG